MHVVRMPNYCTLGAICSKSANAGPNENMKLSKHTQLCMKEMTDLYTKLCVSAQWI